MVSHPAIPSGFPTSQSAATVSGTDLQALANIISALTYGGVIILFSACVWEMRIATRSKSSTRIRPFLYVYIVFMFAMSTMAFIQETIYTMKVIKNDIYPTEPDLVTYLTSLGEPLPLPFTIWGADGFMMWRCLILYQGINPFRQYILIAFLGLLACTSLGSGIAFFAVAGIWQSEFSQAMLPLIPDSLAFPFQSPKQSLVSNVVMFCTTCVNLSLSLLIFLRLFYSQRYISKTLGSAHGSPYLKVIAMCIESCALIVIFSTTNIVMIITNNTSYVVPFLLLPHICVISPLLIVYRVALGRSANGKSMLGTNPRAEEQSAHHSSLRFNQPVTTQEDHDEGAGEYAPNKDSSLHASNSPLGEKNRKDFLIGVMP